MSALFGTVCPLATVKTNTPVLCVQAPAEPNTPAAEPATVSEPVFPVCEPVNPVIVISSAADKATLGRRIIIF